MQPLRPIVKSCILTMAASCNESHSQSHRLATLLCFGQIKLCTDMKVHGTADWTPLVDPAQITPRRSGGTSEGNSVPTRRSWAKNPAVFYLHPTNAVGQKHPPAAGSSLASRATVLSQPAVPPGVVALAVDAIQSTDKGKQVAQIGPTPRCHRPL